MPPKGAASPAVTPETGPAAGDPPDSPRGAGPPPASRLQQLLLAAERGDAAAVRRLVTDRNVNHCDSVHGLSLLSWACANGHTETVNVLLRAGAATDVTDLEGYAPMHRASWNGHVATARALADAGACLRAAARRDGATPLGLAASRGDAALVEFFVRERGVGVNEQDARGLTPLAKAAAAGHQDIIEWLLLQGADSTVASHDGATPRSICDRAAAAAQTRALRQAYMDIITLLSRDKAAQSTAGVH